MEGQSGWTVPLFQLEEYPVGLEIDPSTATDAVIIDYLRAKQQRRRREPEVTNAHLASLHPSELPRCFLAAGLPWTGYLPGPAARKQKGWQTPHGLWKQRKEGGYTAARRGAVADSSIDRCYIGVKRTLDFHMLHNGAKTGITGWTMIQYNKLDQAGTVDCLAIDEKLIFCKVFELRNDGQLHYKAPLQLHTIPSSPAILGQAPEFSGSFLEDLDSLLINFNPENHPIYGDLQLSPILGNQLNASSHSVPLPDGAGRQPMRRTSAVWENFTEIRGKDPQDVYAACIYCNGILRAHGDNGTSQLWRHYDMHLRAWTSGLGRIVIS